MTSVGVLAHSAKTMAGAVCAELLEHGVQIWRFLPSMLHAKVMTVDSTLATVGSANFNSRSTELDEEINLVAIDEELVRILDDHFEEDLRRSEEVVAGEWENRSMVQRLSERLVKPLRHKI